MKRVCLVLSLAAVVILTAIATGLAQEGKGNGKSRRKGAKGSCCSGSQGRLRHGDLHR